MKFGYVNEVIVNEYTTTDIKPVIAGNQIGFYIKDKVKVIEKSVNDLICDLNPSLVNDCLLEIRLKTSEKPEIIKTVNYESIPSFSEYPYQIEKVVNKYIETELHITRYYKDDAVNEATILQYLTFLKSIQKISEIDWLSIANNQSGTGCNSELILVSRKVIPKYDDFWLEQYEFKKFNTGRLISDSKQYVQTYTLEVSIDKSGYLNYRENLKIVDFNV